MVDSIEQLQNLPMVAVLYVTGTSGEFLAHALTQSIPSITKTRQFWENNTRCKYFDLFDRSFNSGFDQISIKDLLTNTNRYLELNKPTNTTHIGLVHPHPVSLLLLKEYFYHVPVIEITAFSKNSRKFRELAARSKVDVGRPNLVIPWYHLSGYKCVRYLQVEWEEFVLTHSARVFSEIEYFLGISGDQQLFENTVQDYRERNKDLLAQL